MRGEFKGTMRLQSLIDTFPPPSWLARRSLRDHCDLRGSFLDLKLTRTRDDRHTRLSVSLGDDVINHEGHEDHQA
jgi:hypothetical protein